MSSTDGAVRRLAPRAQSWSPYASGAAAVPMRRATSLPAGYVARRPIVSFKTELTPHSAESTEPLLLPSVAIKLEESSPSLRRGVSLVVRRSSPRRSSAVTHTLTVDAWLLSLLLLFSFAVPANGFVLLGNAVAARGVNGQHSSSAVTHMNMAAGSAIQSDRDLDAAMSFLSWKSKTRDLDAAKSFVSWKSKQTPDAEMPPAEPPGSDLENVMSFLKWKSKTRPIESEFSSRHQLAGELAAEVASRAAKSGRRGATSTTLKPRQVNSAAELALELSKPFEEPTVVIFGAKSCRSCRQMQPRIEKVAKKAGAKLLFLHYGRETDSVYRQHEIKHTPTVHVYGRDGNLLDSTVYNKPSELSQLMSILERASPR